MWYKLYSIIMNDILIILTIYTIVFGGAMSTWWDGTMEYELIDKHGEEGNFNYLNAIISSLILQGDTKHV